MRANGTESTGVGTGQSNQQNLILGQDEALALISGPTRTHKRRLELNFVQDIISQFEVGSNVTVITNSSGDRYARTRTEKTGIIKGFKVDKTRGWQVIVDSNGKEKAFSIDPKSYLSIELRITDKGIELLDTSRDNVALSIERI